MRVDWQLIVVALIVGAALAYVMRRAWARLRGMRGGGGGRADAGASCGNCPGGEPEPAEAPRARVLVQIGRERRK